MTNITIREAILDLFRRSKCKAGQMVPMRTINMKFQRQGVEYRSIINQLEQEGLVEIKEGSLTGLFLTEKGYDEIYTCRSDSSLIDLLMLQFRKTNCKVGQGFMFRTLQYTIMNNLNPKEEVRFIEMCNRMISEDYIIVEFENNYPQFVKLTDKGYHYIYG